MRDQLQKAGTNSSMIDVTIIKKLNLDKKAKEILEDVNEQVEINDVIKT